MLIKGISNPNINSLLEPRSAHEHAASSPAADSLSGRRSKPSIFR